MAVQLSAAACVALFTAPLAGIAGVVAQMVGRGGRLKLTFHTLARSKADVIVVLIYDILGAVLAILALVLLGISKPSPLVDYFRTDPVVAWAVFGVVGPAFAIAFLDRIPVVRLVELSSANNAAVSDRTQRQLRAAVADGVALRRKSVERIYKCHYEDLQVVEEIEHFELQRQANRLIAGGMLHFDDVARQLKTYVEEHRDGKMPGDIKDALEARQGWPTDEDLFSATESLVGVAIDAGLRRPVNIACRVAESIKNDQRPPAASEIPSQ
jgi:hypothetical protein